MPRQLVSWQPRALGTKVRGAPPLDLSPWEPLFVIMAEQLFKQGAWGSSLFLIKCPPSLRPRRAWRPGAGVLARANTQPQRGCVTGAHRCRLQVEEGRGLSPTPGLRGREVVVTLLQLAPERQSHLCVLAVLGPGGAI